MMRGTLEHPKFLDLQARLDRPRFVVAGVLECLWHFTAKYAPDGGVGKWPNGAIARAVEWDGAADSLIGELTGARWLEPMGSCRLYVHDYHEHADDAVQMANARALRRFANGAVPKMRRLSVPERQKLEALFAAQPVERAEGAARAHSVRTQSALPENCPAKNLTAPPEPSESEPFPPAAPAPDGPSRGELFAIDPAKQEEPAQPAEPGEARESKKSRAKPRTGPPEALTPEQRAKLEVWVRAEEPWALGRIDELVRACLRHFQAKGGPASLKADWLLTVENWITNEREKYGRAHGARASPAKGRATNISHAAWDEWKQEQGPEKP